jgi:hypothetical protein
MNRLSLACLALALAVPPVRSQIAEPIRLSSAQTSGQLPALVADGLTPNSRVIVLGGGRDYLETIGSNRRFTWPFEVLSDADGKLAYEPKAGVSSGVAALNVPPDPNPLARDSVWLAYEVSTDRWARHNRNFERFRNLRTQLLLGKYASGQLEYNSLDAIWVFLRPNVGGWYVRTQDGGLNDLQTNPVTGYSTIRPNLAAIQPIGQTTAAFTAPQNGDLIWIIDLAREGFVSLRYAELPLR